MGEKAGVDFVCGEGGMNAINAIECGLRFDVNRYSLYTLSDTWIFESGERKMSAADDGKRDDDELRSEDATDLVVVVSVLERFSEDGGDRFVWAVSDGEEGQAIIPVGPSVVRPGDAGLSAGEGC